MGRYRVPMLLLTLTFTLTFTLTPTLTLTLTLTLIRGSVFPCACYQQGVNVLRLDMNVMKARYECH